MKKLKLYEDFLNESDAYTISRLANDIGLAPAQDFLDSHSVNIELLKKDISQGTINKYDLRDIIRGNAHSSKIKKFIKTYVNESVVNESKFKVGDRWEWNTSDGTKVVIITNVKSNGDVVGREDGNSGEFIVREPSKYLKKKVNESVVTEKDKAVFIEFLNKDKNFKKDTKHFKSYDAAVKWAKASFDKFSPDMIKYESVGHSSQLGRINESEIIHHKYDFEGMWAQRLGMTREEYVAHFATMTAGVDEAKLKDIKGKQFEVKGVNFTYVERTGRFYGVYLYDVAKTSNVANRLKLSSMTDANEFLALHGITEQLPYRYDEKELDVICKKLAKQGIVCDHNDNFDVS